MLTSTKENIESSTRRYYDYSFPKKHVRFNTPTKSDPRLNQQKNRHTLEASSMESRNRAVDMTSSVNARTPFQTNINDLPPRMFHCDTPLLSHPLKTIDQNLPPRPSNDLELSILDYPVESIISNRIFYNNDNKSSGKENFLNKPVNPAPSPLNSGKKITENDVPYSIVPTKTPLPNVHSELLSQMSPGLLSSAAHSKKDFSVEKPSHTPENLGFFTLPNSTSFIPKKDTYFKPNLSDVATRKNHFQKQSPHTTGVSDSHMPQTNTRCCREQLPLCSEPESQHIIPNAVQYQQKCRIPNNDFVLASHDSQNVNNFHNIGCGRIQNIENTCCGHTYPKTRKANQNCCRLMHQICENVSSLEDVDVRYKDRDIASETITHGLDLKRKEIELRAKHTSNKESVILARNDPTQVSKTDKICDGKTEPTVSDLYEIIKLQNQQLQKLQQRVDKLITDKESTESKANVNIQSSQDFVQQSHTVLNGIKTNDIIQSNNTETPVNCIEQSMHKISIGVMTSFELVMSSNVVNKRNFTGPPSGNCQSTDLCQDAYAQTIQNSENTNNEHNGSVYHNNSGSSEHLAQARVINFLDGIEHYNKSNKQLASLISPTTSTRVLVDGVAGPSDREIPTVNSSIEKHKEYFQDFKSQCIDLGPVQKDQAEHQTYDLNLNTNDESEDEYSEPDVGWTFYNNVMSRVNHMLQSPSSNQTPDSQQSENARREQIAVEQRQVVSTKRVTMDASAMQPAQFYKFTKPASETSLHMTRLAAKYLNNQMSQDNVAVRPSPPIHPVSNLPQVVYDGRNNANEMSFATMQYMQRYHLLSVDQPKQRPQYLKPIYKNPSRILDITALKQQSKLL